MATVVTQAPVAVVGRLGKKVRLHVFCMQMCWSTENIKLLLSRTLFPIYSVRALDGEIGREVDGAVVAPTRQVKKGPQKTNPVPTSKNANTQNTAEQKPGLK